LQREDCFGGDLFDGGGRKERMVGVRNMTKIDHVPIQKQQNEAPETVKNRRWEGVKRE
jgi:hypothetical protein